MPIITNKATGIEYPVTELELKAISDNPTTARAFSVAPQVPKIAKEDVPALSKTAKKAVELPIEPTTQLGDD
jgi:hypothetical protein